jgi:type VI secretion system protein ImpL
MHIRLALDATQQPLALDDRLIQNTRAFLNNMPSLQLAYIVLKNINNNNIASSVDLGLTTKNDAPLYSRKIASEVPAMFTGKSFPLVITHQALAAANEVSAGNWVLGNTTDINKGPVDTSSLVDQLRTTYVNNYVDVWESLLANIEIATPSDLKQADAIILSLSGTHSPLLQLLNSIHVNTFFDPITFASPKLQMLNALTKKSSPSQELLYQIFAGLTNLHHYLQPVIHSANPQKVAFDTLSDRMKHAGNPDAITQLRIIAERSPEPIKSWLIKLSDDTWRLMMENAGRYLNTAWQTQVWQYYRSEIANDYPFKPDASTEVSLKKFTDFFGNPGIVTSFYHHYLKNFVDTTKPDWRWKSAEYRLPFTEDTLRQVQQALRIHHAFFPNGDDKLYVRFAIQPYQLSKQIARINIKINDKQVTDDKNGGYSPHVMMWPNTSSLKLTSLQITFDNRKIIQQDYPGEWGWYRLVNHSFENIITRNQAVINLSAASSTPAKYLLFTEGPANPFLALNLKHFKLPEQLV